MGDAPRAAEPRPIRPPTSWPEVRALGGFHREVGFEVDVERSGKGFCTVTGRVEHRHLNINGVVHGGVYATILDSAMGGSVVSLLREGEVTATTSMYIEFVRPASEGATLSARGEVVRRGRHLAFVEGALTDQDGRHLSQARGTWYIWSSEDGTWSSGAPPGATRTAAAAGRKRHTG
jgi:uncharacterized protein (TIGR00369 family)